MPNIHTARIRRRTRGVTMVESLCAISILATTLGLAMPSMKNWQERQALLSAAAELETDIQYARSHAVAQNTAVHLTVRAAAGGACYVMHTGEADDCTCSSDGDAMCTGSASMLRYSTYPERGAVRLLHRNTTLTFSQGLGTVTPAATFRLQASSATIHQIVSIMGRTRSCSPDKVPGIRAC